LHRLLVALAFGSHAAPRASRAGSLNPVSGSDSHEAAIRDRPDASAVKLAARRGDNMANTQRILAKAHLAKARILERTTG